MENNVEGAPVRDHGAIARTVAFVRAKGGHIAIEVLVNFALPLLIYNCAEQPWGEVRALIASSAPPIAWSIVEFLRRRQVDAVSMLALGGIVLSLLAFVGGGGVRALQLREKLVTGVIGLVFLGSAAVGRPLIYELSRATMQRRSADEATEFAKLQVHPGFRRTMMIMTLVWGLGLVADVGISVALIFALSVRSYLIVGPVVGYATMGGLGLWSFWYARRAKRRGDARRAAEAALAGRGAA